VESDLSKQKESNKELEGTITNLKENLSKKELKISQLHEQLEEKESQTNLAIKQYDGLKETIKRLEEENDTLSKRYADIEGRILQEKEKFVELMNKMNTENEGLKKKIEMLAELNKQEKKRFIWSAKGSTKGSDDKLVADNAQTNNRKFGGAGVVVPTSISQKIFAHQRQTTCLR
jgi:HK97 family phage major capsid protein